MLLALMMPFPPSSGRSKRQLGFDEGGCGRNHGDEGRAAADGGCGGGKSSDGSGTADAASAGGHAAIPAGGGGRWLERMMLLLIAVVGRHDGCISVLGSGHFRTPHLFYVGRSKILTHT